MENNCGKKGYASFREAQEIVNAVRNNHNTFNGVRRNRKWNNSKDKRPIRSYKCDVCGMFHLTSKRDRK